MITKSTTKGNNDNINNETAFTALKTTITTMPEWKQQNDNVRPTTTTRRYTTTTKE